MVTFRELLGHICLRPGMYVGRPDFAFVAAFLNGYDFARSPQSRELSQFGAWLARKFRYPSNFPWDRNLLRHCGDDPVVALRRLPELYDEYVADSP
jgi:hypothetical protein